PAPATGARRSSTRRWASPRQATPRSTAYEHGATTTVRASIASRSPARSDPFTRNHSRRRADRCRIGRRNDDDLEAIMPVTLNPYLNFKDSAREALEFYQSVFGGEL